VPRPGRAAPALPWIPAQRAKRIAGWLPPAAGKCWRRVSPPGAANENLTICPDPRTSNSRSPPSPRSLTACKHDRQTFPTTKFLRPAIRNQQDRTPGWQRCLGLCVVIALGLDVLLISAAHRGSSRCIDGGVSAWVLSRCLRARTLRCSPEVVDAISGYRVRSKGTTHLSQVRDRRVETAF